MENRPRISTVLGAGLWVIVLATLGALAADAVIRPPVGWLTLLPTYCLAVFALTHSLTFLGPKRGLWFLALGLVLPFIAEYLGTNFGAVFGSHWFARTRDLRLTIGLMLPGKVPLSMVLTWYGMLYLGFVTAVILLRSNRRAVSTLVAVPLTAGLIIALWQLTAGPAMVTRGAMDFLNEGWFYRIPLSNFIGWFATAMFVTLFFMVMEPTAAEAGIVFGPAIGHARLVLVVLAATVIHPVIICFRAGLTGAGVVGTVLTLLLVISFLARSRGLTAQPTPTSLLD